MLKLISLHGKFSGSAAVESSGNGKELKITVKLRGSGNGRNIPQDMTVYLVGGPAAARADIRNGEGKAKAVDFRGLLIACENGSFIAEGLCGMNNSELEKAKAAVRMMDFSSSARKKQGTGETEKKKIPNAHDGNARIKEEQPENKRAFPQRAQYPLNEPRAQTKSGFSAGNAQTGRGNERVRNPYSQNRYSQKPQTGRRTDSGNGKGEQSAKGKASGASAAYGQQSGFSRSHRNMAQVTSEILDTARQLFEMQSSMNRPPVQSSENPQRDAFSSENLSGNAQSSSDSFENPFPQLFPDSEWKTLSGDASRLAGRAKVKGVYYDITAVRSNNRRYPPKGLGGNIRRLYSKDGKLYWIGIVLRK